MKLLTKTLKKQMPKLYSTEIVPLLEKVVICKLFNPYTIGTWYIVEGEERAKDDYIMFGLAHLHEWEWGYIVDSHVMVTTLFSRKVTTSKSLYY